MFQAELLAAAQAKEKKGTFKITQDLKGALLEALTTPQGRTDLQAMDTCPDQIKAPAHLEGAITSINLVPLPTSAFPTYRLCNGNEAALQHLREAGCGSENPG